MKTNKITGGRWLKRVGWVIVLFSHLIDMLCTGFKLIYNLSSSKSAAQPNPRSLLSVVAVPLLDCSFTEIVFDY